MWKPVDFQCGVCGHIRERFIDVPIGQDRPESMTFRCHECNADTTHHSIIGLPAPYMGEKVLNPQMYGGEYDTMGHREPMPLPDLPGQAEHSAKIRAEMSKLPDNATSADRKRAFSEACKDAPSSADYSTLFNTPEYKETEAINKKIDKENKAKRKRAAAIARGENINMRRDKVAGDPNITA